MVYSEWWKRKFFFHNNYCICKFSSFIFLMSHFNISWYFWLQYNIFPLLIIQSYIVNWKCEEWPAPFIISLCNTPYNYPTTIVAKKFDGRRIIPMHLWRMSIWLCWDEFVPPTIIIKIDWMQRGENDLGKKMNKDLEFQSEE